MDLKTCSISLYLLLLVSNNAMAQVGGEVEELEAYKENIQIQTEILNGVKTVATRQRWGFICAFNKRSIPLLLGSKEKVLRSVAVAGKLEKGRIVGFGHDAALDERKELEAVSDRKVFFDNVFKWVAFNKSASALLVYSCIKREETIAALRSRFGSVEVQIISLKNSELNRDLKPFDVVVVTGSFSESLLPKLMGYIKEGGGVVVAATNWWYGHLEKNDLRNWAPRKLTAKAGFVYYGAEFDYPDGDRKLYSAYGVLKSCPVMEPSDPINRPKLPADE